jgi:hypothetical protein
VFICKHISVWLFLTLSVLLWAVSLWISFEYLINADWTLIHRLWIIKVATVFMPIFWILFLLISVFFSYYNFKHTQKGYKYSFIKILWLNIVLSIVLWLLFYISWSNHFIEWVMENNIPKYRSIFVEDRVSRMIKVWQNEEKWLLLWRIHKIDGKNLDIIDHNNKNWIIIVSDSTEIKPRVKLATWERIKIMWEKLWDSRFRADQIRPFIGRDMRWLRRK